MAFGVRKNAGAAAILHFAYAILQKDKGKKMKKKGVFLHIKRKRRQMAFGVRKNAGAAAILRFAYAILQKDKGKKMKKKGEKSEKSFAEKKI